MATDSEKQDIPHPWIDFRELFDVARYIKSKKKKHIQVRYTFSVVIIS